MIRENVVCGRPRDIGRRHLMVRGVIFDMDGLMFDTERVWQRAWAPTLEHFGYGPKPGIDVATRGTTGAVFDDILRSFLGDDVDADAFWEYFSGIADETFARRIDKKPGLDELVDFLADEDIPCGVASSSSPEQIAHHLRMTGMEGRFTVIVSGKEVPHTKPEPDIFLESARRMGVDPGSTLVLEDSFNGVRAGVAGGFITVMVPDLSEPDDEMRSLYTRCCADLFEVRDLLKSGEIG
jgi:HAD superfamily hydrolase (TIGR01509 family)